MSRTWVFCVTWAVAWGTASIVHEYDFSFVGALAIGFGVAFFLGFAIEATDSLLQRRSTRRQA